MFHIKDCVIISRKTTKDYMMLFEKDDNGFIENTIFIMSPLNFWDRLKFLLSNKIKGIKIKC